MKLMNPVTPQVALTTEQVLLPSRGREFTTSIEMRMRQERLYTLIQAQAVSEGKVLLTKKMSRDLDRYSRWQFGKTFSNLVQECLDMELEEPDSKLG